MLRISFAVLLLAVIAASAVAQDSPAAARVRIAGTIDKLDGNDLRINRKDGQSQTVTLDADAAIYGVEKRSVADIKPGDFVASGGVRGADGKIHAVEVRIFPETLRGTGEGQRPWSVKADGVMTNATVGTVTQSPEGGVVHVAYKDGESEYTVGPEVPLLAYVPADRSLLKADATVVLIAQKKPDGSLATDRVTVEKNGVKPPM
ncbi:MAG: hypothetical protein JO058_05700 [Alphaproteobacteria bacterium]|nr:hypothetical protein [Alphaproteobacteria bacterium]